MNERARRVGTATAALLVACAPLVLGGATAATHVAIVIITALCALGTFALGPFRLESQGERAIATLFTILVFFAAFQALSLPCGFVETLTHDGRARFVREVARAMPYGRRPVCTISFDRGATLAAIGSASAMLLAFFVGVGATRTFRSSRPVVVAVAASATAVCLVTGLHDLLGATRVYGLYAPTYATIGAIGPLLNANHLALVAGLGFLASAHFLLVETAVPRRIASAAAAAVNLICAIETRSRGGALGLALALVALVFVSVGGASTRSRQNGPKERRDARLIGGAILVVTFGIVAIDAESLIAEFTSAPIKFDLLASSLRFAANSGPFGVGRGAFSAAFVTSWSGIGRATHAENLPAQWGAELGPVLACVVLVPMIGLLVRALLVRRSRTTRIAAAMALLALVHDFADFALELVGVAALFGLVLGAALAGHVESAFTSTTSRPDARLRVYAPRLALAFAVMASVGSVAAGRDRDLATSLEEARAARGQLRTASIDSQHDRIRRSDALLLRALADHPFEPTLFVELAANAASRSDPRTIRWSNFALRRAPRWLAPHVELATYFFRARRSSQALGELAIVAEADPRQAATIVCPFAPRLSPDRLARLIPTRGDSAELLNALMPCMPTEQFIATIDAALESGRRDGSLERFAIEATARLRGADEAERRFRDALARNPHDGVVLLAGARLAIARRDGPTAQRLAQQVTTYSRPMYEVEATIAEAAAVAGDEAALRRVLGRLQAEVDAGRLDAATVATLEGDCAELARRDESALGAFERAYEATPTIEGFRRIERVATRLGRLERLARAKSRFCRDFPSEAPCTSTPSIDRASP